MPTELAGVLFLENGKAVQPELARLDEYVIHEGRRQGHWPTSGEIENAMFDYYRGQR